jgi:pimeloyl-ACP methyl ester carboxylesterase
MVNRLRGYDEIRRNHHFWFYSYPSGYPYPYSAAILWRELDAIEKRFPLSKPMVVIGHSMGGWKALAPIGASAELPPTICIPITSQ